MKKYTSPEILISALNAQDIITASVDIDTVGDTPFVEW